MNGNQKSLLDSLKKILEESRSANREDKPVLTPRSKKILLKRTENESMEYRYGQTMIAGNMNGDRVFPVDTVILDDFKSRTDLDAEGAVIHLGMSADEYARNLNVLAFAVGNDIFFRNKGYSPETEEGRVTLTHELTHVAQDKRDNLGEEGSVEFLEQEARQNEVKAKDITEGYRILKIDGKDYHLTEKQYMEVMRRARDELDDYIMNNRMNVDEEEYLKILIKYEKLLKEGYFEWQK